MTHDIQTGLEHLAQRIAERIPNKMAAHKIAQIIESLENYVKSNGVSWKAIAKQLGISESTLNLYKNGKYKGDVRGVTAKVVELLNRSDRKERIVGKKPGFVRTTVARRIEHLVKTVEAFCDDSGRIGVIIGDSGHGKSRCLEAYAKAHTNVVYVELEDGMGSRGMFQAIGDALNAIKHKEIRIDTEMTTNAIRRRIALAIRDLHITVILDESSGLNVRQLNQIRQSLVIKGQCALILAGNEQLDRTINLPTTRHGNEALDQFRARRVCMLDLNRLAAEGDGGGLYTTDEIVKLYQYGGIRLATSGIKTLRRICRTPGTGRMHLCDIIVTALHTSKEVMEKGYIWDKKIFEAIFDLGLANRNDPWVLVPDRQENEADEAVASAG